MSSESAKNPGEAGFNEDFYRRFQHEQAYLRQEISRLSTSPLANEEKITLVDQCLARVFRLSNALKDIASYLPAHDQRTYSTAVKSLTDKLQELRNASAPKRKFAFKKAAPPNESSNTASSASDQSHTSKSFRIEPGKPFTDPSNTSHSPDGSLETAPKSDNMLQLPAKPAVGVDVSDLISTHYILATVALPIASSASLTNIRHGVIDLSVSTTSHNPFAALAINNVEETLLLCGTVSGAGHITGVKSSVLVISSRQVRMHDCKDCVIFLHCSSRPIIEDCKNIKFAPLPALYGFTDTQSQNLWDQVDDFKWLRVEHSPNWSVLQPDDEHAIGDDGWKSLSDGQRSHLGLEDLLRIAKVTRS